MTQRMRTDHTRHLRLVTPARQLDCAVRRVSPRDAAARPTRLAASWSVGDDGRLQAHWGRRLA